MKIEKYFDSMNVMWDEFVKKSKNGHFMFCRKFMDYHRDRYQDYSLMIYDDKDRLISLLPANIKDDVLYTHGGLTFGGFITDNRMTTSKMLEIFDVSMKWLSKRGVKKIIYKCIPYIYYAQPSDEDRYALFRSNGCLIRRDVSTSIYMPERNRYMKGRKAMISRGKKNGVVVRECGDYDIFMRLENDILRRYHNVRAVHTVEEITYLAKCFPRNIRLFVAEKKDNLLAGIIVFINRDVVHTQYMANSDIGREIGALDVLVDYLITDVFADCTYFDFGISTEKQGQYLNEGLISQKEGFGGRAVMHDFYELDI